MTLYSTYETVFEAIYNADEINNIAEKIIELLKVNSSNYNNIININNANNTNSKIILLHGELGAGKTTLTQALIAKLLGKPILVSSPTFNINNIYSGQAAVGTKEINIAHFDLYRIKNITELYELGIDELLKNNDFSIIEWPDLIEKKLLLELKNCPSSCHNNLKHNEHNVDNLRFLKINLIETEEPDKRIVKIKKIKDFSHLLSHKPDL